MRCKCCYKRIHMATYGWTWLGPNGRSYCYSSGDGWHHPY
jgi:hypothetical protein